MGSMTYARAGVDPDRALGPRTPSHALVDVGDPRVINKIRAFGSLVEGSFPGYEDPVLVLKMGEPGSRQLLALRYGRIASLCHDLINHLVNDGVDAGCGFLLGLCRGP